MTGTKRIYLFRHATAGESPTRGDHDRPLTEEGRLEVATITTVMQERGWVPGVIYCSGARRTVETSELLVERLSTPPHIEFDDELYLASQEQLLDTLRARKTDEDGVMLLAHNPGLANLISLLCVPGTVLRTFPPASLAVIDCPTAEWKDIKPRTAHLIDCVSP